ncbi:unnamed protein product [Discosporangium mesarthrocarpum]
MDVPSAGTLLEPTCTYWDDKLSAWETNGVVLSEGAQTSGGTSNDQQHLTVTCSTYHLTDFTVAVEEVSTTVQTVGLAAGLVVFSALVDLSTITVVISLLTVGMLSVLWMVSTLKQRRSKGLNVVELRSINHFVNEGHSRATPNCYMFEAGLSNGHPVHNIIGKSTWWTKTVSYGATAVARILRHHPLVGIVAPSESVLTLSPAQVCAPKERWNPVNVCRA